MRRLEFLVSELLVEVPQSAGRAQSRFEHAVSKGLSVRELEHLVRTGLRSTGSRRKLLKQKDQNVAVLEDELQKTLGTKVRIMAKRKRGKIIIEYYSNEDLDRLINIIKRK